MSFANELKNDVKSILGTAWMTRQGRDVPESESIKLGNDSVKIMGTVLYADMSDSTKLVDNSDPKFAAEIYKIYLHCAAKIIRSEDGKITAYDGDRVMAVYFGDKRNSSAVRSAMKIKAAVTNIINPAIKSTYPRSNFYLKHVVGIDTSDLFIAKTGIRGANDLVWVGRAANYAAKLSALPENFSTRITKDVYDQLQHIDKFSIATGEPMWEMATWQTKNNLIIYRSNWSWKI